MTKIQEKQQEARSQQPQARNCEIDPSCSNHLNGILTCECHKNGMRWCYPWGNLKMQSDVRVNMPSEWQILKRYQNLNVLSTYTDHRKRWNGIIFQLQHHPYWDKMKMNLTLEQCETGLRSLGERHLRNRSRRDYFDQGKRKTRAKNMPLPKKIFPASVNSGMMNLRI